MAGSSLSDRLRQLRRPAPSELPPGTELDRLEERLLGDVATDLPLKERLERLVTAASRRDRRPATAPRPLEELVPGREVRNAHGSFLVIERDVPLDQYHGDVSFSRFRALSAGSVTILAGEPELHSFDLGRAAFLDTETTGLAGGTGTAAFLVGLGFVDDARFRVRQYLMRDYQEEAALLSALAEDLRPFGEIVTFNGKMFDVPLLEARYRLNRQPFPLATARHLDLLHPARRLWKLRLESCRLQSLEASLLGVRREGDIPGEDIPQIYFDYLRRREAQAMAGVLEHNRLDVVSLAALAVLACQWVEEGWAEDPRDIYSLGRVFERAQLHERSRAEYRRALAHEAGPWRGPLLLRLARHAKKAGDFAEAVALWGEAAEAGETLAFRELAIHHEHRRRDAPAALEVVERALAMLAGRSESAPLRCFHDFSHRRKRLIRKVGLPPRSLVAK